MLTFTHTTVTREQVRMAFRRTYDSRLHERYHGLLLQIDGRSCPDIAQGLEHELMPGRPA